MNQPISVVTFDHLPDSAYIRLRQLVGTVLPFSPATLWRKCRRGEFPAPVRVSEGITAWRVDEIRLWLEDPAHFKARRLEHKSGRRLS